MAQVIEHLPSKNEALSSNVKTTKNNKDKREREKGRKGEKVKKTSLRQQQK
jgi:hypothetical protein